MQGFGLSAASSRPCFPPGVGWEGFGIPVYCFMAGDDLGQKCWNHLKGTFSLSLTLCSVEVLTGLPLTAMTVGQSQGLSDLQGSGCGQQGGAITSGFPVSSATLLSTPAEGSSKHQLSRKKNKIREEQMKVGKKKSSLECLILEIGKKQCLGTGPTCLSDGAKVFLGAAAVEVPCCYPAGPYLPKLLL